MLEGERSRDFAVVSSSNSQSQREHVPVRIESIASEYSKYMQKTNSIIDKFRLIPKYRLNAFVNRLLTTPD
ncbi:hypothetical protein KIN20_028379 [Parelaphostrongylus tenuis]|uniref:Uncharacterized protein n=1 Tax=Parelaphostrongylus tenuis TaxID=148309 RepID=A0AAD5R0P5_PARTN|nr:hypothetical protein KIN20_028379 [Parelaphostrongylus tenuis]